MPTGPKSQPQPPEDPFTTLLTLEDTLYTTAYANGLAAGARAGKIEGRIFGLEKGFNKFATLGALHGRAVVWEARLRPVPPSDGSKSENQHEKEEQKELEDVSNQPTRIPIKEEVKMVLPTLPPLPRLLPNVMLLHSLTDPLTFSTANTEDAIADLDDRLKRGVAKAKIIELLIKEPLSVTVLSTFESGEMGGSPIRRMKVIGEGARKDPSMEDFVGSGLLL